MACANLAAVLGRSVCGLQCSERDCALRGFAAYDTTSDAANCGSCGTSMLKREGVCTLGKVQSIL